VDVGHGGMDLAEVAEVADMTEVEVMEAPEVLRAEVPEAEDMAVEVPEADIRKDKFESA
jgi:hypothetical protein